MSDKGILYKPDMAEAANKGFKTQTRRTQGLGEINKEPDAWAKPHWNEHMQFWSFLHIAEDAVVDIKAPFTIGHRLYHKEAHYRYGKWVKNGLTKKTKKQAWRFKALPQHPNHFFEDTFPSILKKGVLRDKHRIAGWYKRSPLFMPKAFARSWWRVTDVGCQRVASISVEDIQKEGLQLLHASRMRRRGTCVKLLRDNWIDLWNSIHGDGAWAKNEWVFCPTFTKIERPKGGI